VITKAVLYTYVQLISLSGVLANDELMIPANLQIESATSNNIRKTVK